MLTQLSSIAIILVVVFQTSATSAQERIKLRVSSAAKTLGYGPLWIASKMGFFAREGLDVDLVVIRASDVGIQALAGGSLEIAGSAADAPIAAIEKGLDLVIFGGIINGLTQSIMAAKKFKTYNDLRGATFGAISLTSGVTFALRQVLKVKGLEYPRDYKLLVIGGTPQSYAALTAGQLTLRLFRYQLITPRKSKDLTRSAASSTLFLTINWPLCRPSGRGPRSTAASLCA